MKPKVWTAAVAFVASVFFVLMLDGGPAADPDAAITESERAAAEQDSLSRHVIAAFAEMAARDQESNSRLQANSEAGSASPATAPDRAPRRDLASLPAAKAGHTFPLEGEWLTSAGTILQFHDGRMRLIADGRATSNHPYSASGGRLRAVDGEGNVLDSRYRIEGVTLVLEAAGRRGVLRRLGGPPALVDACVIEERSSTGNAYADKAIAETDWSSALWQNMKAADAGCEDAKEWLAAWSRNAPMVTNMLGAQAAHEAQSHARRAAHLKRLYDDWYHHAAENEEHYRLHGDSARWRTWKAEREAYEPSHRR